MSLRNAAVRVRKSLVRNRNGLSSVYLVGNSEAPFTGVWLHGLLGSNSNWVNGARQVVQSCRDWKFLLPQLRNHGLDRSGAAASPPHTITECVGDLIDLLQVQANGTRPDMVIGHSFGGKVALEYLRTTSHNPDSVWLLDTMPGRVDASAFGAGGLAGGSMLSMLRALKELPQPLPSKEPVAAILTAQGAGAEVSRWIMGMVVRSVNEQEYRFNFDVQTVEELLVDYLNTDSWDVMSSSACTVNLVIASNSHRWEPGLLRQLESVATTATGRLDIHKLQKACHWMHNEPEAVCNLIASKLALSFCD